MGAVRLRTTMEKTSPTAKASDPVPRITPMAVVKPTTCSNTRLHHDHAQRHEGSDLLCVHVHSTALPSQACICHLRMPSCMQLVGLHIMHVPAYAKGRISYGAPLQLQRPLMQ